MRLDRPLHRFSFLPAKAVGSTLSVHKAAGKRMAVAGGILAIWLTGIANAQTFRGAQSCASSTCHGGVVDRGPAWRHSLTRWVAEDPHADAGLVLYNDLSAAIVFALDPSIATTKANEVDWSEETQTWRIARDTLLRRRCISCHMTATPKQCADSATLDPSFLAAGVSCESCHGAADVWIDDHYSSVAGPLADASTGMKDTESIVGRAQGCVRCHVGSRTDDGLVRDMNHDLIAAGHPVLRFDLSLYDAGLPKHWDRASSPRFYASPVRVRQVGRAVALAAAATLAAERAKDHLRDRQVPWPELSDYDCFACHQSLSMDQYALPASDPGPKLRISDGLPIWNSWHTIGQKDLTKDKLKMLAPNQLDAETLAVGGLRLAQEFQAKADEYSRSEVTAANYLQSARNQLRERSPRDWHEAAVIYLDIEAALRELAQDEQPDGGFSALRRRFESEVQGFLRFSTGLHSPANFDVEASNDFRDKILEVVPEQLPSNQPNLTN